MIRYTTRLFAMALVAFLVLSVRPAEGAKGKTFVDSDDAKEKDEPAKFLPNYDKLTKGKDADWVYFHNGSLRSFKTVHVHDFEENGRGRESRDAAHEGRDTADQVRHRFFDHLLPPGLGGVVAENQQRHADDLKNQSDAGRLVTLSYQGEDTDQDQSHHHDDEADYCPDDQE